LFFLQGASLADPKKILKGSGKQVRSIRITDAADLDRPEVREMMKVAVRSADPTIDPKAERRVLIRAIAAKQRARRA
jgi:hypothetical protein